MKRKRKSGENYVRLCEKDIQHRVLHSEICDNEGISYGQIKGRLGNKSQKYERRLKKRRKDSVVGKKKDKSKDIYGKERERFYNRNGWEINARELGDDGNEGKFEEEIIRRKRDGQ